MLERWQSAVGCRNRARTKRSLEKLREVEQEAIAFCGEAVELCIAHDFLDSFARCGMIEARQQVLGNSWTGFAREIK